jgi:arabinofuranosyltransferase
MNWIRSHGIGVLQNPRSTASLGLITAGALLGVFVGWRLFWFLTDDAFIAFRYASSSYLGNGYVWNPPPFRAVEGYTSFLWVFLLDVVWRFTGFEPPQSANWLSLIFAYLTLLVGAAAFLRIPWAPRLRPYQMWFLALTLAAVIANRTFLAWTSSGLETALFNFLLTLWVLAALMIPTLSAGWLFVASTCAVLASLTRPDGILMVLATIPLIGLAILDRRRLQQTSLIDFASVAIMLVVPLHLIWRHQTYGAWLPNTYVAKVIPGRLWVESGLRYLLSFVIEYSIWFWLAAVVAVGIGALARFRKAGLAYITHSPSLLSTVAPMLVVMTLLGQVLYYTLVVGGDHFEYRVYSHLLLLLFVSFAWMLNKLELKPLVAGLLLLGFVVASLPIPWTHWLLTHNLQTREETIGMQVSVSEAVGERYPHTPGAVLAYLKLYDDLQSWLISRAVCTRHQEHKMFQQTMEAYLVSREEGLRLPGDDYPVIAAGSVGVIGWNLPRVNVIDMLGLNDYVVARNPELSDSGLIAHERQPPPGYVECFTPNVELAAGAVIIHSRAIELTADAIAQCESEYAELIAGAK